MEKKIEDYILEDYPNENNLKWTVYDKDWRGEKNNWIGTVCSAASTNEQIEITYNVEVSTSDAQGVGHKQRKFEIFSTRKEAVEALLNYYDEDEAYRYYDENYVPPAKIRRQDLPEELEKPGQTIFNFENLVEAECPITIKKGPYIFLHLRPKDKIFFNSNKELKEKGKHLFPMQRSSDGEIVYRDLNENGMVSYSLLEDTDAYAVTQFFNDTGDLWGIESYILGEKPEKEKYFATLAIEDIFEDTLRHYIDFYETYLNTKPAELWVGLIGIKGYKIPFSKSNEKREEDKNENRFITTFEGPAIKDEVLYHIQMDNYKDYKLDELLRPLYDKIWDNCGFDQRPNVHG